MFTISETKRDDFEIIVLKDSSSDTFAEIIPACGGILHSFNINHNNGHLNVIDGYSDKQDFEKNLTAKGFKSCKLSPFACRIKNATYTFEGTTYRVEKFLLNKNALHGLLYDAAFKVVEQKAGEDAATVILKYEYRGTEKGYPFYFDCIVSYRLRQKNELLITTEIINKDEGSLPIQDGWHPYFTLGKKIDELELILRSKEQVVFDSDIIPTGELKPYTEFSAGKKLMSTFFDDCFLLDFSGGQPFCILKDADNKIQVEIRPDKSYPYIQLYTPPHRNSIAIENLSAPPDIFNDPVNLMILHPGESANFTTSYIITSLK